ncbi:unnamed protein product [Coccothraustes coccothraustes]
MLTPEPALLARVDTAALQLKERERIQRLGSSVSPASSVSPCHSQVTPVSLCQVPVSHPGDTQVTSVSPGRLRVTWVTLSPPGATPVPPPGVTKVPRPHLGGGGGEGEKRGPVPTWGRVQPVTSPL